MRGVYRNHNRLICNQWFLVKPMVTPGYYTQAHHRICVDVLGVLSFGFSVESIAVDNAGFSVEDVLS